MQRLSSCREREQKPKLGLAEPREFGFNASEGEADAKGCEAVQED